MLPGGFDDDIDDTSLQGPAVNGEPVLVVSRPLTRLTVQGVVRPELLPGDELVALVENGDETRAGREVQADEGCPDVGVKMASGPSQVSSRAICTLR